MTTPTMLDLVNAALEQQETARRVKFDAARTNTEKLMALGVIVSCDDEFIRASQWSYAEKLASEAGVTARKMADALEYSRLVESILDDLRATADNGETPAEFNVRLQAASANSPHPIADGMRKPCKHNETKKTPGLFLITYGHFVVIYRCCRCGTQIDVARRPLAPTAAALEAMKLLALYDRPQTEK